ncbi:hypothetical protein HJC23_001203 [Cyclotella cryptica]|uniref:Uncharacterized protein n=1 Tax=Cyclotella cryptica TaxID=29204 RepID=A0ABD3QN22_9STRA|eukprot:CCRYP_003865-RB/>CCRYP_003865-RB protein AED:0.02 eAED:0.02 QI:13/-1/1/1/-1/1/1/849/219
MLFYSLQNRMSAMKSFVLLCLAILFNPSVAFTGVPRSAAKHLAPQSQPNAKAFISTRRNPISRVNVVTADLETVALVAGQENYGLAVVVLGEALWSFSQALSLPNVKVIIPAAIAAIVLFAVSGPMVTSGDAGSVALGLEIATAVSALLGASYVARLAAPFSDSPKEIAFLGLLVAVAGFFSFSQNLVVDGFIQLPNLPSIPLPQIPLGLGEDIDTSIE